MAVRKTKKGAQLKRWFKEKWVDVRTGKPCGRRKGEKRGVPYCRPSKRISSKTVKTAGEMSSSEKAAKIREKKSLGQPAGKPRRVKNVKRGRIKEYADHYGCEFQEGRPWGISCDIALPCATQNELDESDANTLVSNGCICVSEGANMPSTPKAVEVFLSSKILFAPGKASNAGGVATSGLEMSQNSLRMNWTREEVDQKLKTIMNDIHSQCIEHGKEGDYINYVKGANIAGFLKVADAMLDQGVV